MSDFLNKQEAAEHLGVTVRSVEAYAAKGKLTAHKAKGRRGDIAVYDLAELDKLKEERERVQYVNPFALQQEPTPTPDAEDHFAITAYRVPGRLTGPEWFIAALESLTGQKNVNEGPSVSDLSAMPLLKLDEASRLTGLSRGILKDAISAGKLKAKIVGRAWRIKRPDLDAFVKKL